MTINKRKKSIKYRGCTTHGWGSMKKRRGAGNRGGRGMAGSGKRGDAKKSMIWSNPRYFGKHGFKKGSPSKTTKAVNVQYINDKIESFASRGLATEKSGSYEMDLSSIGVNKLLGSGSIIKKVILTVESSTDRASEKIEKAGGKVNIILQKEEPKEIKKQEPSDKESKPEQEKEE
ncbi:50S ribosomal protein L15 [Candidatus Woesearchaeota archaeon]|nr:50S ribosomal protein L15 [Candidatus Woesearchaeota archaeon]